MKIVDVASVLDDLRAEIVRLSVRHSSLDAAARQPRRISAVEMAASHFAFGGRRAPEFRGEDHQRIFQQAARFQIGQQARDRLVDFARQRLMRVDVASARPNSCSIRYRSTPRTGRPVRSCGAPRCTASRIRWWFRAPCHTASEWRRSPCDRSSALRHRHLHAERGLVRLDPRIEHRIARDVRACMLAVEFIQQTQFQLLQFSRGRAAVEIRNGLRAAGDACPGINRPAENPTTTSGSRIWHLRAPAPRSTAGSDSPCRAHMSPRNRRSAA